MSDRVIPTFPYSAVTVPGRRVGVLPLEQFVPEVARFDRDARIRPDTAALAGWGFKATAAPIRRLAARHGLPYLALEDSFLRSVGLGEAGTPTLGLIVDDLGIYYDSRQPSRLETLLETGAWDDPRLLNRAEAAITRLVSLGLSKTNASPPLAPGLLPPTGRRRILVTDQTAGDASLVGGLADESVFRAMIDAARVEADAGAEIVIRRHPAVAAGLKAGAIPAGTDLAGFTLLDVDARIADILARVDEVWTATSLTGFEALLRGLPVRCFGLPFYAGWGLTRDEQACARRTRGVPLPGLFAAAFILYSRYRDPITGLPTSVEDTIERLGEWRDAADAARGHIAAIGFRPWKRAATRTLVAAPDQQLAFCASVDTAAARVRRTGGRLMIWSGKEGAATRAALAATDLPVLRMEDGFIRSRGLGSDFHLAASVVLDDLGIYYDRHQPSRLETILECAAMPPRLLARAAALRARMVAAGLSKYNVGGAAAFPDASGRFRLLVVGQVEDDRSIERGAGAVTTNLGLVQAARRLRPDAWIAYKPHPDVESGNRRGAIDPAALAGLVDHVASDVDIAEALGASDGLATITSLAGFEALLRGLKVWTLGGPFYAGWGLTEDALAFPRRTRRLSLDELAAGTLLLYPRYVHPPTGLPCRAEELVTWLTSDAPAPGSRRLRWLRAVWESVHGRAVPRY